ncbi:MAG: hypothetical protein A2284_01455 [Deltaproteobacteria bacterium RIFOXYA12_FULL_61_11]|nr:MAG: hypothetical protein A2284_01455 [Deltaproteobacteria bacterium RIFOXYA12_FULL_61_11]
MSEKAQPTIEINREDFRRFCHDMRSALAVITSFLDLLSVRQSIGGDDKARHFIERCGIQAQALHDLLDGFDAEHNVGMEGSSDQ